MAQLTLKKLLGRRSGLSAVLDSMLETLGPDVGVLDAEGRWLIEAGTDRDRENARYPVLLEEQVIGWVAGRARPEHMAAVARLLSYAAGQEAEKRSLATEVLERYRELNLLYTLSEKLAASPQPAAMAAVALGEAGRLIPAQTGMILSLCGDAPCSELMAAIGSSEGLRAAPDLAADLVRRVLNSGQAEVENDVPRDTVFDAGNGRLSLLCAPLKTEQRSLGALLLVRDAPEPFSAGELKLLNSVAMQVAPALEVARLYQVAVEKARMERELQMARQVQASLIPTSMPNVPGWEFASDWRPALEVAGDFFDLVATEDGQLSLVIADVSGKGMPASLFMVFTRSVLRASMEHSSVPAEGLARANRLIAEEARAAMFVTLFYARLNLQTGDLTYVNAGHNPPLLYRSATAEIAPLTRTGMALGILEDSSYEQKSVRLQPGDSLLFYTDGLTEAFNGNREEFGMERVRQVVQEHQGGSAGGLVTALETAVDGFTRGAPVSDDMTLLALKRL
ncbi:MAG TPA: GAF domain-containing SpoIIE family protein phosphatase [Anaerolineae bacterium]|nr:GAF domain-containing SpoIIE family protein phosphatase [Anaerolineae bacterium]